MILYPLQLLQVAMNQRKPWHVLVSEHGPVLMGTVDDCQIPRTNGNLALDTICVTPTEVYLKVWKPT